MRTALAVCIVAGILAGPPSANAAWMGPSKLALVLPEEDPTVRFAADEGTAQGATAIQKGGRPGDIGRSLVLPGWGQWQQDYRGLALGFFAVEAAIWTTFFVSVGQGHQRRDSYEQTALLFADIDLRSQDEDFRKLVGQYISSEEYNRLVVMREAASLYLGNPSAYWQYIDENSLEGDQSWAWSSESKFFQYGSERRSSEQAFQRAEYAVAAAVVNRLLSGLAAWRMTPKASALQQSSTPTLHTPGGRLEWTLVPDEKGVPGHRVAWVLDF
jgi:hypothetical protein